MSALITQIVKAYEELNLSLDIIAEEFSCSELEVKTILMSYSRQYRKDMNIDGSEGKKLNFSEDDLSLVTEGMMQLFHSTDDEQLKFRILKYVRDDAKGRKDMDKNLGKLILNAVEFNNALQLVASSRERTIAAANKPKELAQTIVEVSEENIA